MSMSRDDAVAALRDIEGAEARARVARAYRFGAPHLFIWGAVWVVGYSLTGLVPGRLIGPAWIVLSVIGVAGSLLLRRARIAATGPDAAARSRLWYLSGVAIWLFIVATYAVLRPTSAVQYEVFPALIVSLVYALVGSWGQPRYLWISTGVFVLSLVGFFFLKPVLPFWLAGVGGGGLILGGFWLRQA